MTNLLLAFPDIPQKAVYIDSNNAFGDKTPVYNLRSGERYQIGKLASTTSSLTRISLDLGTQTVAANHLIIARADLLKLALCTTITLKGWSTNVVGSATTVYTNASFASATLYGPRSNDFFVTFTASTAYRYWWVEYTVSATSFLEHSKVYFGSYFDFLKDPDNIELLKIEPRESKEYSTSGAVQFAKNEQGIYRASVTWTGITDDTVRDFTRNVANASYRNKGIFLFTTSDHTVLDTQRIIHSRLLDFDIESVKTDWNIVTATFEEITG